MTSIQNNYVFNSCVQNQSMPFQNQMVMQQFQQQHDTLNHGYTTSDVRVPLKHLQPKPTSAMEQRPYIGYQPYNQAESMSVARRNARERNRVKQVNDGYANLRQHIPQSIVNALTKGGRGASKKLSKVDTLKLALEYIYRLQDVIEESDSDASSTNSSMCENSSPMHSNSSQDYAPFPRSEASMSPTSTFDSGATSVNDFEYNSFQYGQQMQPVEDVDHLQNTSVEDDELLDCIAWWQQE